MTSILAGLLLAQTASVSFAGGSTAALAHSIHVGLQKPVVALVYDFRPIKKFNLPFFTISEFRRDFHNRTGWNFTPADCLALTRDVFPRDVYNPYGGKPPTFRMTAYDMPKDAIGARVNLTVPAGTFVTLQDLQKQHWPKVLKVHWFFLKTAFVVDAQDSPATVLLAGIAEAVGGKLVETDSSYSIDFDPERFRDRAIKTLTQNFAFDPEVNDRGFDPRNDPFAPVVIATRRVQVETLKLITNEQLTKVFQQEGKGLPLTVDSKSPLATAIQEKLDAYKRLFSTPHEGADQVISVYRSSLDHVDWTVAPRVYFSSPLSASIALRDKVTGGTILL